MKVSKQSAAYVPHAKQEHCDTCANWRNGICTKVQGPINADGHCEYYDAKMAKKGGRKK